MSVMEPFPALMARVDAALAAPGGAPREALAEAEANLTEGEAVLEAWLRSRGQEPTEETVEGFRLLALHRQGARGDPSFNACRETCRELVYLRNLVALHEDDPDEAARALRLQAMVLKHLALFVGGKLQEAGLGDFCCSARPVRAGDVHGPDRHAAGRD